MQLPVIEVVSDSDSDSDDIELFQVPEGLLDKPASLEGPDYLHQVHAASTTGDSCAACCLPEQPAVTAADMRLHDSLPQQNRSEKMLSQSAVVTVETGTQTAGASFQQADVPSDPVSGSSSSSHIHAEVLHRSSSSDSSSSSSSVTRPSDEDLSLTNPSSNSAAGPDSSKLMLLSMDCLLADNDLDDLLSRLTAAAAVPGSPRIPCSPAPGKANQPVVGHGLHAESSSELSSGDSTTSLPGAMGGTAMGAAAAPAPAPPSPPPAPSNYSPYQPPWLRQQQQQQHSTKTARQAAAHAASAASLSQRQHTAKVWVPQHSSTALDVRTASATAENQRPSSQQHVASSCRVATGVVSPATAANAARATRCVTGGQLGALQDSSDSDDSSEEEWEQFRMQQRAKAHMHAAG